MAIGTANGTKLYYETAVAGTWQVVPYMVSFDGWNPQVAEVDVSNLDTSSYRQFVPGLYDPGTADHTIRLDLETATQYEAVFDFATAVPATSRRWALVFPIALTGVVSPGVSDTIYGTAFPQSLALSGGVDAPADFGLTLRFTGALTRSAGLPSS